MQGGYLSSQAVWLANLLARRPTGLADPRELDSSQAPNASVVLGASPAERGYAATRDGSDALILRILDEAASTRPPMGLFDPREFDVAQEPTPPAFRAASPSAFDPREVGEPNASDALVLRILDAAASKRPPIGLFDPRESDPLQAPTSSEFRGAIPPVPASQPVATTARDGSDALVQRILDEAAPMGLVDPRGLGSAPVANRAAVSVPVSRRGPRPISTIPPIAPPPGVLIAEQLAPVLRATGFDFSQLDQLLAGEAIAQAADEGVRESLHGLSTPNPPSTSTGARYNPIPVPYGELSDFKIVKRIPGGGASDDEAYRHWYKGSGNALRIEFSGADVEDDLKARIGESAAGGLAGTFRNAINESLLKGQPAFVNTTAPVDTGDIVRGRVDTRLTGWVTTTGGRWRFDGSVTGKPEPFDFNSDPARGFIRNAGTIYAGNRGHLYGAKDYEANYAGAIQLRAGGQIRP